MNELISMINVKLFLNIDHPKGCPRGWELSTGSVVEGFLRPNVKTIQMCADECYWDAKCQSFEFCEKNCQEGSTTAPFEKRCELNYDPESTSSIPKENFVFCTPASKNEAYTAIQ